MLSTQLNGGPIAKYRPIGHEGQPIYKNAEAFIAALKLYPSVGEKKAQCLAVPRISADGLNIDWYVPFSPKHPGQEHNVIAWNSASPQEKQQALVMLQDLEQSLRKLGSELQRRGAEGQSKLMASYLTGQNTVQNLPAIHFPGPEYVYIVDEIPVITFWGFENKDDDLRSSPLDILRKQPTPDYVPAAETFAAQQDTPPNPPFNDAPLNEQPYSSAPQQPNGQANVQGHVCPLLGITIPPCIFNLCLGLLGLALLLALLWFLLPRLGIGLPFDLSGCSSGHSVVAESPVVVGDGTAPEAGVVDGTGNDSGAGEPAVADVVAATPDVAGLPLALNESETTPFYLPDLDWASMNLPYSLKGKFVGLDLDGDGVIDAADINGDGQPDTFAKDTNNDGFVDLTGFDFNNDGKPDSIGVDLDNDGQLDTIAMDLTGDNFADALDFNGDGRPDLLFDQLKAPTPDQVQTSNTTAIVVPNGENLSEPFGDIPLDSVDSATAVNSVEPGVGADIGADVGSDLGADLGTDAGMPSDAQLLPDVTNESGVVFTEDTAPTLDPDVNNTNGTNSEVNGQNNLPEPENVTQPVLPPVDPNFTQENQTAQTEQTAQTGTGTANQALGGGGSSNGNGNGADAGNGTAPGAAHGAAVVPGSASGQHNLQFTSQTIHSQGAKVLDGQWNTRSALMDSTNGRPLQMGYSMKDGQGQVEITRADGVKCVAPANAATIGNGIAIKASGQAVCPDKRSYTIPQIECQAAANGTVKCKGTSGNSEFPIQLYAR